MTARDNYALLGLGQARSMWLGDLSAWATSGVIPATFTKCLSTSDARQRIESMTPYSALILEVEVAGFGADLIDCAQRRGIATIIIDSTAGRAAEWSELGAACTLPANFTPPQLHAAITAYTRTIGASPKHVASLEHLATTPGALFAVCGPGGTGASTIAIALSQGIASDVTQVDHVILADLARNGEQAMLHDAPDIINGVEEMIDAHRGRRPSMDDLRSMTFAVPVRGYRLLLGMRRKAGWAAMTPRAIDATLTSLQRCFRTTIADITSDFETEAMGGSIDVEERNGLALSTLRRSDVVVVVGTGGMKGVHALARTINEVLDVGIASTRVLPVINRAQKGGRSRAAISGALSGLIAEERRPMAPIFIPDKAVEDFLYDNRPLPKWMCEPITNAVLELAARQGNEEDARSQLDVPIPIKPGSLGMS